MAANATNPAAAPTERSQRPTRTGVVTSDVRNKTISVTVSYSVQHPKYGKHSERRTKYQAHDEQNEAKKGDIVEIAECRPISKTKSWRLVRILTKAPRGAGS
jgi:small subunit ribosomal protein S17